MIYIFILFHNRCILILLMHRILIYLINNVLTLSWIFSYLYQFYCVLIYVLILLGIICDNLLINLVYIFVYFFYILWKIQWDFYVVTAWVFFFHCYQLLLCQKYLLDEPGRGDFSYFGFNLNNSEVASNTFSSTSEWIHCNLWTLTVSI